MKVYHLVGIADVLGMKQEDISVWYHDKYVKITTPAHRMLSHYLSAKLKYQHALLKFPKGIRV